jgi:N6-L-threonylcarbamoyladenine synthase
LILAIETSCDETAAAVVRGRRILANEIASQAEMHAPYGGVVPEVAARHHIGTVNGIVDAALAAAGVGLDDVEQVAVTQRPGLIGALLVGVATAKALAYARRLPLTMVDHLHGHILATWLEPVALDPPFVSLVASGGHTRLDLVRDPAQPELIGQTIDDAAGEAVDKGARTLGLGYPGGPALDLLAREGDTAAFAFPIGLQRRGGYDFSFAGVKTALLYTVREIGELEPAVRADLAASYQEAIMRPLADRLIKAALEHEVTAVTIGGGVAANSRLRALVEEGAACNGLQVAMPDFSLCTDNAAMIGAAAQFSATVAYPDYIGMDAMASAPPGGIAA